MEDLINIMKKNMNVVMYDSNVENVSIYDLLNTRLKKSKNGSICYTRNGWNMCYALSTMFLYSFYE